MIPRIAISLAVIVLTVAPSRAGAQTAAASTTSTTVVRPRVLIGAQFGTPTNALAGGGVLFDIGGRDYTSGAGPLVMAGVGIGGFRIGGGVGGLAPEGPALATGVDLQVVASRTSDRPRHASAHATYLGVEAGLVITDVRLTLGFAHRLTGAVGELRNILTWSVGVQIPIGAW